MPFSISKTAQAAIILVVALACAPASGHPVNSKKISTAAQSVVSLLPQQISRRQQREEPEGSGVVIDDGQTIITAAHVLGASDEVLVRTQNGVVMKGTAVMRDTETDIALIRIASPLQALTIANETDLAQPVCAVGNGFGLGISVTCGSVSAIGRSGMGFNTIEDFIQTDAAVNPGMSGGALLNQDGELVGMLSAIFTKTSDANIGVNFAVSAPLLKSVIADHQDNNRLDRARPRIRLRQYQGNGSSGMVGAEIDIVPKGSPEKAVGLRVNDVIVAANGRRVFRPGDFSAAVAMLASGEKLAVLALRDGKAVEVSIDYWQ